MLLSEAPRDVVVNNLQKINRSSSFARYSLLKFADSPILGKHDRIHDFFIFHVGTFIAAPASKKIIVALCFSAFFWKQIVQLLTEIECSTHSPWSVYPHADNSDDQF